MEILIPVKRFLLLGRREHCIHSKVSGISVTFFPISDSSRVLMNDRLFPAQSEGSIGMEEGEELDVVELDQGDGWTRVRRINGDEEGFVPTSYIEVEIAEC